MKKDLNSVLIRPHITEKASMKSESSVYVFEISPRATKAQVEKAFADKYKIDPVKVSTVTIHAKNVFVRGKKGTKSGYKKAYIYLKKGEKIEII
jgi:large subunit ribosomal protein L23